LRAEAKREQRRAIARHRWIALVLVPIVSAICWAALPWTFGMGARSLISFASYYAALLAVASRMDTVFLSYLGLSLLPAVIDGFLLVGVVSWLVWASRAPQDKGIRI